MVAHDEKSELIHSNKDVWEYEYILFDITSSVSDLLTQQTAGKAQM